MGLLRAISLTALLLFAPLLFSDGNDVRADEPPKPPPIRRIRVPVREPVAEPAPTSEPRSPLRAVITWALRRSLGDRAMGEADAARAAARNPLRAWFAGGPHVFLADLRDALVADGWTADSLLDWVAGRFAALAERTWLSDVSGWTSRRRTVVVPVR